MPSIVNHRLFKQFSNKTLLYRPTYKIKLTIIYLCEKTLKSSLQFIQSVANTGITRCFIHYSTQGKQSSNSPLATSCYPAQHHCTHGRTDNWVSRVGALRARVSPPRRHARHRREIESHFTISHTPSPRSFLCGRDC